MNLTLKTAITVYISQNLSSELPTTEIILHAKKPKLFEITL